MSGALPLNDPAPEEPTGGAVNSPPAGCALPPELKPLLDGDPRTVGPYRIVGRLGAGGMGAVYGGLDEHDRCLAVKTIHAAHATDPRFRASFAREVELLRRVRGVCTATVHAADPHAPTPWMASDYIPGRNLRQHIRQLGPLEGDMLLAFAAGTAEALTAIHAAGIVHRDIKPGNVILAPDGPKIVDFGIATTVDAPAATDGGSSYGTPGWVAPERYTGGAASGYADIFAWGGLVVLAATGRNPFGGGTPEELRQRVCAEEPDLEGVPTDLLPLLRRALAKTPEERPLAEEAFRSLVAHAWGGTDERTQPNFAFAVQLRSLLQRRWHGIEAGWHHPALWVAAAAAGTAGGVAVAGAAAGTVGTAGASIANASGAGVAGVSTGASGAAAGSAGAGATTAGTAAGAGSVATGSLAAGAGIGKVTAIAASVAVGAAVAGGGYFAYETVTGGNARESVVLAVDRLEEGAGFVAEVNQRYTLEHAEEEAQAQGGTPEQVREATHLLLEYRFSGGNEPVFLAEGRFGDGRITSVANVDGAVYAYGPAVESGPPDLLDPDSYPGDTYGPAMVTAPARSLAEAADLTEEGADSVEGVPATVFSGTLTGWVLTEDGIQREDATGRIWLGDEGEPLRLEYTTPQVEVTTDFSAVDESVTIEEPEVASPNQVAEPGSASLLLAPVCGRVEYAADGRPLDVRADTWDMSCAKAMEVAEVFVAGEGDWAPGWQGSGVQTVFIEEWACSHFNLRGQTVGAGEVLYHCNPATYTGGEYQYEVDDSRVDISFINVEER